jgi:hypothetical protein
MLICVGAMGFHFISLCLALASGTDSWKIKRRQKTGIDFMVDFTHKIDVILSKKGEPFFPCRLSAGLSAACSQRTEKARPKKRT